MHPSEWRKYTPQDLPRLDKAYESVGLLAWWLGSEQRQLILIEETEDNSETA